MNHVLKPKKKIQILLISLLVSTALCGEKSAGLDSLSGLVSKVVDLKKEIAAEKQKWSNEDEFIKAEAALLEKEKKLLEEEIRDYENSRSAYQQELLALNAEKKEVGGLMEANLVEVAEAQRTLLTFKALLPGHFKRELTGQFKALENSGEKNLSERLQAVFTLYGEIEKIQNEISVVKEVIATEEGDMQEFDAVYLGLSFSYFISRDRRHAGYGERTQTGWKYIFDDSLKAEVQKALEVNEQKDGAFLIELPLKIKREQI